MISRRAGGGGYIAPHARVVEYVYDAHGRILPDATADDAATTTRIVVLTSLPPDPPGEDSGQKLTKGR